MTYFNETQIEALKEAEEYFRTVVKAQWKRGTTIALNNRISDIYEEATGKKINRNWACSQCCYNAYLTIGKLYYESIDELNRGVAKETEPDTDTQAVTEEGSQINNKKRGRPKKNKQ